MLHIFSAGISIILLITSRVLIAEIKFVQTRNGKTVPIESSKDQQNPLSLQNNVSLNAGAKFFTNSDIESQTTGDKTVPNDSSIHELNSVYLKSNLPEKDKHFSNVRSGSKNGKFSFLLDSHEGKQMAKQNVLHESTKDKPLTTPDLITSTDIQVLQKFVKKLKSSVTTERKGQALSIQKQVSSKLSYNRGSNYELRKTPNIQPTISNEQQKIQNPYQNKVKHSSNQNKLHNNIPKAMSQKETTANLPPTNNLNKMSKSDVDALLSVAKEWKRLHSEDNEKQQHSHEIVNSNNKNNMQRIDNKKSKENTYSSSKFQRYQRLGSQNQYNTKTKQVFSTFGEKSSGKKLNPISTSVSATISGTGFANGNAKLNDPKKQLKETVDKAIANTTQQLLQFIKLEKQLKQDGSFMNGSKSDVNFTNSFTNLINTVRKSTDLGGGSKEVNDVNTDTQNLNKEDNFKSKNNPKSNANKQKKLEKQASSNEKESSNAVQNSKSKQESNKQEQNRKEDKAKRKHRQRTKTGKNKLQQRLKAKSQDHISYKQRQRQRQFEKLQLQQHKDVTKERKKVKAQTQQKVKNESQKHENNLKPHDKQQEQDRQQKQEQEEEEKQQQEQLQQQDQAKQQQLEKSTQNSTQTNEPNEYNTQANHQEEIKQGTFQSPNTSTTDEQREDDVIKVARHFRLKTMKHLIASLAEDPFDTWIYHQKSFDELGITPSLLKAGIVNLGSSKPMQHAVRKAVKGKNVKMLVIGGSISAGGGLWKDRGNIDGVYHKAITQWWTKTVTPVTKSEIEVDNVAIGGTDSEYFSYCIDNYLESNPDIVLWELSANDYNRFNERNFDPSKPLEQLTRIILQLPSHPALIYVNFFRGDKQNFELEEKCPDSEETEVDVLSRYYDIPSLSWRRMVCNLITKRTFVNQELFGDDGYHPNLLGHAQVAMLLMMYIKGVFESVLADDLDMKRFNNLEEDDIDLKDAFQLKIPAFKDPLNPKPCCWTLLTPDYTRDFKNTLPDVNVLKGDGFELRNVTAWDVRTDRIQCLLATKPGAVLDLSLNVPVLDDDRNLPLADAQTRTLAIATHNKFSGAADVQLDELPSKKLVANGTGKLKHTIVHIVSEDVRPGVHNLRFRSLSTGFCLTSIMVI